MNKGEPAKLATSARIRDDEHLERIFSRDASSAGDCLHARGVQYLGGNVGVASHLGLASWRKANSALPLSTTRK